MSVPGRAEGIWRSSLPKVDPGDTQIKEVITRTKWLYNSFASPPVVARLFREKA